METKRAIIYARVSSVGDRQNTERQISDLTRYAEFSNLTVARVFEEYISGAKRNMERPILLEAIEYARSEGITQILISELSRLGRNAFEVLSTVKDMIDAGINIYFQKEQFSLLDERGSQVSLHRSLLRRSQRAPNLKERTSNSGSIQAGQIISPKVVSSVERKARSNQRKPCENNIKRS